MAIRKYGVDAFIYEVIEECPLEKLDEREKYWITFYNTFKGFGYNCNAGGGDSRGENNGRTCLTNEDIVYIRKCYAEHKRRKEIYEFFKDKISFDSFARIWDGSSWKDIMPEVYTEENKIFYSRQATNGGNSPFSKLTNEEVLKLRQLYVDKSAKELYKPYKDIITFDSFQKLLWGKTYKDLPLYKKKQGVWVNAGEY